MFQWGVIDAVLRLIGSWFGSFENAVNRTLNHLYPLPAYMRIDFRGLDTLMTEEVLNVTNINTLLQQVRRKGVTK